MEPAERDQDVLRLLVNVAGRTLLLRTVRRSDWGAHAAAAEEHAWKLLDEEAPNALELAEPGIHADLAVEYEEVLRTWREAMGLAPEGRL
jgi:hypothetical protein